MPLRDLDEVIGDYTGLARKALDYTQLMKRLVDQAKLPGFSEASWAPLAAMIDTERFERVGNFKEVMRWNDYAPFLTQWAATSHWECSFKRVTEQDGVVILELEERSRIGDFSNAVNSVSVYEFDEAGLIHHLDIYLQMPMPDPAMLANYDGIAISG